MRKISYSRHGVAPYALRLEGAINRHGFRMTWPLYV